LLKVDQDARHVADLDVLFAEQLHGAGAHLFRSEAGGNFGVGSGHADGHDGGLGRLLAETFKVGSFLEASRLTDFDADGGKRHVIA
jgi:hypothetical protein